MYTNVYIFILLLFMDLYTYNIGTIDQYSSSIWMKREISVYIISLDSHIGNVSYFYTFSLLYCLLFTSVNIVNLIVYIIYYKQVNSIIFLFRNKYSMLFIPWWINVVNICLSRNKWCGRNLVIHPWLSSSLSWKFIYFCQENLYDIMNFPYLKCT